AGARQGARLAHRRPARERVAAAGSEGLRVEAADRVEREGPFAQMRVAAVAGRAVLDELARQHHLGVRNEGDDVARRVPGAEVEELDLAAPEEDRHRALEGKRRPG